MRNAALFKWVLGCGHRIPLPLQLARMNKSRDLTGKWAVCSHGRIGLIETRQQLAWGLSWVGTGLDGKPWASRDPRIISDSDAEQLTASTEVHA